MKKILYLSSCSTCKRIMNDLDLESKGFVLQDIKVDPISEEDLDRAAAHEGSYEAVFSRRAMKYKQMGLGEKELSENDYKDLILGEYTFLKRPVIFYGDEIFVGNGKKTVEAASRSIS